MKRGNSITWINNDSVPHTATSGNPESGEASTGAVFDTGIIGPGQTSKEITINADAGTYDYYCTLHPYMKGQLTIEEECNIQRQLSSLLTIIRSWSLDSSSWQQYAH